MEETILKMKKTSKAMQVFFKVLTVILYVGMGISLGSIIYLLICKTGDASILGVNIKSGFSFNNEKITTFRDMMNNLPTMIYTFAWMILIQIIFYKAAAFFNEVQKEGTPFTKENVKRMKIMAIVLLIAAVIPNVSEILSSLALSIPNSSELINGIPLTVGFVLICLASVFDYGVQIQRETDELL